MKEYLEFAEEIARYAGKIMLKYFNVNNKDSYKGDKTIVTLADREINSYLIERVKERYPNHCVDGEEEVFGKSNYVWVCDPIDGTSMYARHVPVAVFSLALVIDGKSMVGVIYDPFLDNMYTAISGRGAYCNNKLIRVNNSKLDDIRTMCHCDMCSHSDFDVLKFLSVASNSISFNDIGSIARASMCVASGYYSLAIFTGNKHKNCDVAAVKVIVEEAGGKVTDLYGSDQRYDGDIRGAIISNGTVHNDIIEIINNL